MKYLLIALLLPISSAVMADIAYMDQQLDEMKSLHHQQMLQRQQQQQEETKYYLEEQQKQQQSNLRQHRISQPKQKSFISPFSN